MEWHSKGSNKVLVLYFTWHRRQTEGTHSLYSERNRQNGVNEIAQVTIWQLEGLNLWTRDWKFDADCLKFILKNTVQYCSKLNRCKNKQKKRCDVAVHVPWIYQWHHQMSWMSLHRNLVWVASNHFPSTQSSALCNTAQKTKSHLCS